MDSNDDPKDGPVVAGTAFAAVGVYGVGALFSSPFVVWRAATSLAAASRGLYEVALRGGNGVGWKCMGKTGGKGSGLGVHKANDHAVLPRLLRPSSMAACARVQAWSHRFIDTDDTGTNKLPSRGRRTDSYNSRYSRLRIGKM
jgi:hypothetical protein